MALFDIPVLKEEKKKESSIKLKKGQTIDSLITTAKQLVMEKLGKYKDVSKCITDIEDLKKFFEETNDLIGIDTETTGLNTWSDELVGISLCNGKHAIYIPVNHKSSLYNTRLRNQINPQDIIELFREETQNNKYKWLYHNSKFDLAVLRTFLGFNMPAPYWDTMIRSLSY